MSKLRLLIGISTAALFAVTAAQANEYYRTKPTITGPSLRRRPTSASLMATRMLARRCAALLISNNLRWPDHSGQPFYGVHCHELY